MILCWYFHPILLFDEACLFKQIHTFLFISYTTPYPLCPTLLDCSSYRFFPSLAPQGVCNTLNLCNRHILRCVILILHGTKQWVTLYHTRELGTGRHVPLGVHTGSQFGPGGAISRVKADKSWWRRSLWLYFGWWWALGPLYSRQWI